MTPHKTSNHNNIRNQLFRDSDEINTSAPVHEAGMGHEMSSNSLFHTSPEPESLESDCPDIFDASGAALLDSELILHTRYILQRFNKF